MRERLVQEAAQLFARRGYAATSVADIQVACGLTAGSGALYKHFPSKRALLDAVVRQHLETMTTGERELQKSTDQRAFLRGVARAVWGAIERDRSLIRIIFRDLDEFPELLDEIWQSVLDNVYSSFGAWIACENERGGVTVTDPAATASVLLASLTYFPILDSLIGKTPGGIEKERYLTAWVEHAAVTLGI